MEQQVHRRAPFHLDVPAHRRIQQAAMSPCRVGIVIRSGAATGFAVNRSFGDSSKSRLSTGKATWNVRASNAGRQAMTGSFDDMEG
ncbi:hypothetical protein [Amycolatopsis eburnea]|uniref:hypothetical protein n=1 Tax=Amycolatopsis eburnea TaxID=2267691 RepID=UPI0013151A02